MIKPQHISEIRPGDNYVKEVLKPLSDAGSDQNPKLTVPQSDKSSRKSEPNKAEPLQDPFLNALRVQNTPVLIYLVNGIRLQGQIESFDQYVILLRNTVTQMVYKHAISTIMPERSVRLGAKPNVS